MSALPTPIAGSFDLGATNETSRHATRALGFEESNTMTEVRTDFPTGTPSYSTARIGSNSAGIETEFPDSVEDSEPFPMGDEQNFFGKTFLSFDFQSG